MYDNLAHLAALAHEARDPPQRRPPRDRQFAREARRTRCRRLLRTVPCPQTA